MYGKHVEITAKNIKIRVWVTCVPGTPTIELYLLAAEQLRQAFSQQSFKARIVGQEETDA